MGRTRYRVTDEQVEAIVVLASQTDPPLRASQIAERLGLPRDLVGYYAKRYAGGPKAKTVTKAVCCPGCGLWAEAFTCDLPGPLTCGVCRTSWKEVWHPDGYHREAIDTGSGYP